MTIKTLIPDDVYNRAKANALKKKAEAESALKAPTDPLSWMSAMFPQIFSRPFGPMHEELFNYVWTVERGENYSPFVAIWPRSMGKSTCVETSVLLMGARGSASIVYTYLRHRTWQTSI